MIFERHETMPIRLIVMRDIGRCIIIIPALNVEIWAEDEPAARDLALRFVAEKEREAERTDRSKVGFLEN